MKKPTKKTIKYYDWDEVEQYLIEKNIWTESFASEFWGELCEDKGIVNGKSFTITDWELKHNKGKYAYTVCDTLKKAIPSLLEHFGEPDKGCLDPGVLTATFYRFW
jgi:hypothetical protein